MEIIMGGIEALFDYIAKHVLTCLIPAFLLAGGITSFINRETIIHLMGQNVNKLKSFSIATFGSFFVAACSCTVIPVSAGLYFGGAGIGAAFIILWIAPASNILSLIYTGSIIGIKMVIMRLSAAILIAFIVGWVMSLFFHPRNLKKLWWKRERKRL